MKTNHINSEPLHALTGRNIPPTSMSAWPLAVTHKSLVMTIFAIIALFQMVFTAKASAGNVSVAWNVRNNYGLILSMENPGLEISRHQDTYIDHLLLKGFVESPFSVHNGDEGTVYLELTLVIGFASNSSYPEKVITKKLKSNWYWSHGLRTPTKCRFQLDEETRQLLRTRQIKATAITINPSASYYRGTPFSITPIPLKNQSVRSLKSDLDDDNDSDIIWRHTYGMTHHWKLENGIRISGGNIHPNAIDTNWRIVDINDMDKDGDGDLIWIHTDGSLVVWLQENGVFQSSYYITTDGTRKVYAGTGWDFVDVEDLDDDGDGDYIWRHTDGRLKYWLIQNGVVVKGADVFSNLTAQGGKTSAEMTAEFRSWKIVDVEDLDFDGCADIVFRNTNSADGRIISMMLKNGVIADYRFASESAVASSWRIVDVADMNSDGHADIIWRNDNGTMHSWIMCAGYSLNGVDMWSGNPLGSAYVVQSAVDFDGDGHGDILMRHTNGQVHGWRCVNGVRQSGFNVDSTVTGLDWTINTHK